MDISRTEDRLLPKKVEAKLSQWFFFFENLSIILKSSGFLIWLVVFVLALLEVKQYYNIDVIPGYDSSVDDFYGALKGTISEFFK